MNGRFARTNHKENIMGDLTIVSTAVRVVRLGAGENQHTAPAIEAITAGQYIRLDPTTGKFALGNAGSVAEAGYSGYIAANSAIAGETVTGFQRPCVMDLGEALAGLSYDDRVFLSDTDGALATTQGTINVTVGTVVPGFARKTAEKLLKLNLGDHPAWDESGT
jgi:hypothetical protein